MDRTDKLVTLLDDCRQLGLAVNPPDVNASGHAFQVADARTIRYGLGAVKGVGEQAVQALVEERAARGPFASLEDMCHRIDLARVVVFAQVAVGVSAVAFGGMSWALDGAAALDYIARHYKPAVAPDWANPFQPNGELQ